MSLSRPLPETGHHKQHREADQYCSTSHSHSPFFPTVVHLPCPSFGQLGSNPSPLYRRVSGLRFLASSSRCRWRFQLSCASLKRLAPSRSPMKAGPKMAIPMNPMTNITTAIPKISTAITTTFMKTSSLDIPQQGVNHNPKGLRSATGWPSSTRFLKTLCRPTIPNTLTAVQAYSHHFRGRLSDGRDPKFVRETPYHHSLQPRYPLPKRSRTMSFWKTSHRQYQVLTRPGQGHADGR